MVSQWPIPPLKYFDYEVRPEVGNAGTYFYHSHVGFQQSTAAGTLIVDDAHDPPYNYDEDIVVTIGDSYPETDDEIEEGLMANPFQWSGEPSAVLLNGKSGNQTFTDAKDPSCAPLVIDVEPDKEYRLRFIGLSTLSLVKLGIEDHTDLRVIEADGEYVEIAEIDHAQVAPGQRFSYILKSKTRDELTMLGKTNFWIRYESRERPTSVSGYALLRYNNVSACSSAQPLPTSLPLQSPVQLPLSTNDYLEYVLEPLSAEVRSKFPTLSEVTRTVTIKMKQQLTDGEWVNGTANGTLTWM